MDENTIEKPNISVNLCGIKLENPLVLASGVIGHRFDDLVRAAESGFGAVVSKTVTARARDGYQEPTRHPPMPGTLIAANGLQNDGIDALIGNLAMHSVDVPVFPSFFGYSPEEAGEMAAKLDGVAPMVELNLSCPHPPGGPPGARHGRIVAQSEELTFRYVSEVRRALPHTKLAVKLSPDVTDIVEIARAAIEGGANALVAVNTLRALEVDHDTLRPVLSNGFGGLSGTAIRCIAQRCVAELSIAMTMDVADGGLIPVPIVAVGGVFNHEDIVRYVALGATCVQVGVAYGLHIPVGSIVERMTRDLKDHMQAKGYQSLKKFRRAAIHRILISRGCPVR